MEERRLKSFKYQYEYSRFRDEKYIKPSIYFIEETGQVFINHRPIINNYEYVDLGLPSGLLWAKCNIGAQDESYTGLYFAWGETVGYEDPKQLEQESRSFDWGAYKYCNGTENSFTKYCTKGDYGIVDNKTVLDPSDDAATVIMGGKWRMPTKEDFQELLDNTRDDTAVESNTNNPNFSVRKRRYHKTDNNIFIDFPKNKRIAGDNYDDSSSFKHTWCWTSTLALNSVAFDEGYVEGNNGETNCNVAYIFQDDEVEPSYRCKGCVIRAVWDPR